MNAQALSLCCLIEDDATQIFLIQKMLELSKASEEVLVFRDGLAAYEGLLARSKEGAALPDLILLDINMPVWDGWTFLREFREAVPHFKGAMYILTSSLSPSDHEQAERFGLSHRYLNKPLKMEQLKEVLAEVKA